MNQPTNTLRYVASLVIHRPFMLAAIMISLAALGAAYDIQAANTNLFADVGGALITLNLSPYSWHAYAQNNPEPFITTWTTTASNQDITLPVRGSNITILWGDGTNSTGISYPTTHTYASPGTYTITVSGGLERFHLNNGPSRASLVSIDQWGDTEWTSMKDAFDGAYNMAYKATDTPDLSGVTDMSDMFFRASSFSGDLSGWSVSGITDMSSMFHGASSFNGDISDWDVSSVTDMSSMFRRASSFNGDLSDWTVSSVTDMSGTFYEATSFNRDISSWDVGAVTDMPAMFHGTYFNQPLNSWDVSSVTDMNNMFHNAFSFNQPLDTWDVTSVTNMNSMFNGARTFNQDISGWDVSGVTKMAGMFSENPSFDQNLGRWYIVLDSHTMRGAGDTIRISAQNGALDDQDPTYTVDETVADGDKFRIVNGKNLAVRVGEMVGSGTYMVTITATVTAPGFSGTDNSRTVEITVTDPPPPPPSPSPPPIIIPPALLIPSPPPAPPPDTAPPTVLSIEGADPPGNATDRRTLVFNVTFSEPVTGVNLTYFVLSPDSGPQPLVRASFPALEIPDQQTVEDAIAVERSVPNASVTVGLNVTHFVTNSMTVQLSAPDGTTRIIHNGTFVPNGLFGTYQLDFNGTETAGSWTLSIHNKFLWWNGTLNSWSLAFNQTDTSHVSSLNGSGSTYFVTVLVDRDGAYNLDVVPGSRIVDEAGNLLVDPVVVTGTDHTYTVLTQPPDAALAARQ